MGPNGSDSDLSMSNKKCTLLFHCAWGKVFLRKCASCDIQGSYSTLCDSFAKITHGRAAFGGLAQTHSKLD